MAARPSGTEPKINFYRFAAAQPCAAADLAAVERQLTERLDGLERDLRLLAGVWLWASTVARGERCRARPRLIRAFFQPDGPGDRYLASVAEHPEDPITMQPARRLAIFDSRPFAAHALVAHVKKGYDARRRSIERQMAALDIPFEFMLDGDIPDLDAGLMRRWFGPNMQPSPVSSCACKHLLMYERLLAKGWRGALILEDDILLADNFAAVFNATLDELETTDGGCLARAWISYENSTLRMPPRRELRDGRLLYRSKELRCTGAYYIGAAVARWLLDTASSRKLHEPIDWFVGEVAGYASSPVDIYWCHPPVAEQGSMNGTFDSMDARRRAGLMRRVKWMADKWYKSARHRVA